MFHLHLTRLCDINERHCWYNMPFIHERVSPNTQDNYPKGKTKRYRTNFREFQLIMLEREYIKTKYCTKSLRYQLSQQLNLPERIIKVWFQNRRKKDIDGIKRPFNVNERASPDSTVEYNYFNTGRNYNGTERYEISQNDVEINNIQNTMFNINETKTNYNGYNTNTNAESVVITPDVNTVSPQFGRESVIKFCKSKESSTPTNNNTNAETYPQYNISCLYPNTIFHHEKIIP